MGKRVLTGSIVVSLAMLGCTSERHDTPTTSDDSALSARSKSRVSALRAGFAVPTKTGLAPFLRDAEATSIEHANGGLIAHTTVLAKTSNAKLAEVMLPERANGVFTLRDAATKMSVDVRMEGATDAEASIEDGYVVYPSGHDQGGDIVHRPHTEGTEDYVQFSKKPAEETLRYHIDLHGVAGLRLVGESLEMLDPQGAPRLRMSPPTALAENGARPTLHVAVEGCAIDTSARAPWNRAVTSPGSTSCTVAITWTSKDYPLLVDPSWTTTGSLATARAFHTENLLSDGRVIVTGGASGQRTATDPPQVSSTELFDPTTNTWSAGPSMIVGRWRHTATLLPGDLVVVAGGYGDNIQPLPALEKYSPSMPVWSSSGSLKNARAHHTATLLNTGNVLLAGGWGQDDILKTAEVLSATGSPTGGTINMTIPRFGHTASLVPQFGQVLLAGGDTDTGVMTAENEQSTSSVEMFNPISSTFSMSSPMAHPRIEHTASVLSDGSVLIAGGFYDMLTSTASLAFAEISTPTKPAWTPTGALTTARGYQRASLLPGGSRVLVTSGLISETSTNATTTTSNEIYDLATGVWGSGGTLMFGREGHTSTTLVDGRVIVAGGYAGASTAVPIVEILTLTAQGSACTSSSLCAGGLTCVDGVCCENACASPCTACAMALTGMPDGTCATSTAGSDPHNDCSTAGTGVCQTSGNCDGTGACQSNAGTSCGAASCVDMTTQNDPPKCDASGACTMSSGTSACFPYVCGATGCKTSCVTPADCVTTAGFDCVAGACVKAGDIGSVCMKGTDCTSSFCEDGVCCDTGCAGVCNACSAAKKGYGQDGTCAAIKLGTDPDDDCPMDPATSCKDTGLCDGSGACQKYGSDTLCGTPSCANGLLTATTCDTNGNCGPGTGQTSCGVYACNDTLACATSCVTNAQCSSIAHCAGGVCVGDSATGAACTTGAECGTGFCADGFCCDTACTGQCEACGVVGSPGTCMPIMGTPRGKREACMGTAPCAGTCDGANAQVCTYPGTATSCGSTCTNASIVPSLCDGDGACKVQPSASCTPYACNSAGDACGTKCATDNDCATGAKCNLSTMQCAIENSTCADAFTVMSANGTKTSCAPYECLNGACQQQCAATGNCASGYECEGMACVKSSGAGGSGGASAGSGGAGGKSGAGGAIGASGAAGSGGTNANGGASGAGGNGGTKSSSGGANAAGGATGNGGASNANGGQHASAGGANEGTGGSSGNAGSGAPASAAASPSGSSGGCSIVSGSEGEGLIPILFAFATLARRRRRA